jgi:cytochrome c6
MTKLVAFFAILAAFAAATPAVAGPDGKALYAGNCAACHQASGKGVKGAFPALAGSALVLGETRPLARLMIKGKAAMPEFSDMSDAELAAILTYARASWGNAAKPVTASEVAAGRK